MLKLGCNMCRVDCYRSNGTAPAETGVGLGLPTQSWEIPGDLCIDSGEHWGGEGT